ncbi:MAG TPA: hypothetical protein VMH02_01980 [Verrucomicrobiae bacterium]|nr:hypothetical protein [Verrucomicrobiae bacterium]
MPKFLLGVNYWPRSSAMYMWSRFDLGEIREDLARIKGLGLDLVRFFLLWEAFQPAPDSIDPNALRRFEAMLQAIGDAGLRAMPTLFCGHMSGVNWLPAWSLDREHPHGRFRTIAGGHTSPYGIGDFYADPDLLEAQTLFARTAGERARNYPALYAWDLGNEFTNLREPRDPADAAQWSRRLTETLHDASGAPATGGLHQEDVERDRHLRPSSIAQPWSFATMHGYPIYCSWSRGASDLDVVPFLCQLMQSFAAKPVLFSELGNPSSSVDDETMRYYAYAVIDRLHARGALGAMWWCWADYAPELDELPPFDCAEHELHFGIVRSDGTEKPVAQALARFAGEARQIVPPPPPIADEAAFYASLPQGIAALFREYCATHG